MERRTSDSRTFCCPHMHHCGTETVRHIHSLVWHSHVNSDVYPLAATLKLAIHEQETTDSHTQYAMLFSWADVRDTRYIPLTCVRHHGVCFPQIMLHRFKVMSVRQSPVRIPTLIWTRCSERIHIAKTTHEMRICILRVS